MNYIPENMAGAYKGPGQRTLFLTLLPCGLISQMKALQLFGVIFLSFSWTGHKGKSCLLRVNKKMPLKERGAKEVSEAFRGAPLRRKNGKKIHVIPPKPALLTCK